MSVQVASKQVNRLKTMPGEFKLKSESLEKSESGNQMFQCANCFIIFDNFDDVQKHLQECVARLKAEHSWEEG